MNGQLKIKTSYSHMLIVVSLNVLSSLRHVIFFLTLLAFLFRVCTSHYCCIQVKSNIETQCELVKALEDQITT